MISGNKNLNQFGTPFSLTIVPVVALGLWYMRSRSNGIQIKKNEKILNNSLMGKDWL